MLCLQIEQLTEQLGVVNLVVFVEIPDLNRELSGMMMFGEIDWSKRSPTPTKNLSKKRPRNNKPTTNPPHTAFLDFYLFYNAKTETMTSLSGLSDAHVILLAVQLCLNGDISAFPSLKSLYPHTFHLELLLRIILTFLPESIEPSRYTPVLQQLSGDSTAPVVDLDADLSTSEQLSESEARHQVRHLKLLPLQFPKKVIEPDSVSPLVQFLVHRAHRIDTEVGLQPYIIDLVDPFISTCDTLRDWTISTVLPAVRFNYEYYPNNEGILSLELLESLDSRSAVNILLSANDQQDAGKDIGRDLRGLIGPCLYGHIMPKEFGENHGTKTWQVVNEWLLSTSLRHFPSVVSAVEQWDGPIDIDFGGYDEPQGSISNLNYQVAKSAEIQYNQAALASIYATAECDPSILNGASRIVTRVAALLMIDDFSVSQFDTSDFYRRHLDPSFLKQLTTTLLLHNTLLDPLNPLTSPSKESLSFIDSILVSMHTLGDLGHWVSPRFIVDIILSASSETQLFEFQEFLKILKQQKRPEESWKQIRERLLWLRTWGAESPGSDLTQGLFWRVPPSKYEEEILITMLEAKQYGVAVELYADPDLQSLLTRREIEIVIAETIYALYNNASNGNKSRGRMKCAVDILDSFAPYFRDSVQFREVRSLITATHALSFYSLTLQDGVPFQPVHIRLRRDPISLIEKVLDQNPKAYTQLDDLLSIGYHLVSAGLSTDIDDGDRSNLPEQTLVDKEIVEAELRIIGFATDSAIKSGDFNTAYSYILTRIAPSSLEPGMSTHWDADKLDDISWRIVYNAGRHRDTPDQKATPATRIAQLSKNLELLSLALILCPTDQHLPDILAVWRRYDEEMSSLQMQEFEEEEAWDSRGDTTGSSVIPGGFGPSSNELDTMDTERERQRRARATRPPRKSQLRGYEEAPMGLFDVARGAAKAISKNAFPLRDPTMLTGAQIGNENDTTRTRKRDVVSNMVTGGLVSGIGWVLGAQPSNTNRHPNPES
ncbi:hypothetical protein FQN57_007145 [Myotisia sp. PD_48]|nr:hypothetical protein FQN57_007145 [Myotisia sp. PD_48]